MDVQQLGRLEARNIWLQEPVSRARNRNIDVVDLRRQPVRPGIVRGRPIGGTGARAAAAPTVERMVAAAVDGLGGLDVLVNNAGIAGPTAPVEEVDPDQWEAVMTVDVIGRFHVTRLSIPHLKKSSAGSIVVMSSVGRRFGYPNRSAYCTAKMGLIGFAKTLSRELSRHNIRVNAIALGAVGGERIERVLQGRADAEHKTLEEIRAAAMSIQLLKRFVEPQDIAALVLFLTSDAGKSISGQFFLSTTTRRAPPD